MRYCFRHLFFRLFLLSFQSISSIKVSSFEWFSICSQKLDNLFNIHTTQMFSAAELVSSFKEIRSVIKWQFAHYSISKFNVKNMVILSCFE